MGKRGSPARIIRCAKPAKCPKCGNRHFLIVVYGYPSNEVIDEIDKYDIRGCCLPPYKKVRDKSGNYYHCPEPKYVCSNQDCRLEVFMRKECEIMPPIDDSYHFYGREWMQQDMVLQSRMLPRLRRLVHDKLGADKAKEVFEKGLKTTNVQQLHELQREYLGDNNSNPSK